MSVTHRQPFTGRHLVNEQLSRAGSEKRVHHHEIAIENDAVSYRPGDAIGFRPQNDPALVRRILETIRAKPDSPVTVEDDTVTTLETALLRHCNLDVPGRKLLELIASRGAVDLTALLDRVHRDDLERYVEAPGEAHDVLDVLEAHPQANVTGAELAGALRRLSPRLYSVASSPRRFAGRVHVLIASVRYTIRGRERVGPASTWLEERWPIGATAECYVQDQQQHFAMPGSPDTPMIMIGPGTGLAPFRGFLQERHATGARGRNWLFFGAQRSATDFYYEAELTEYVRNGLLRLDLAFSRDQPEKVYVQHRMREHATTLWQWLEEGAELFVCGNKDRMAAAVDCQLHEIVRTAGSRSDEEARAYVDQLVRDRRYKRDVY